MPALVLLSVGFTKDCGSKALSRFTGEREPKAVVRKVSSESSRGPACGRLGVVEDVLTAELVVVGEAVVEMEQETLSRLLRKEWL
jgi:hypothetical protein